MRTNRPNRAAKQFLVIIFAVLLLSAAPATALNSIVQFSVCDSHGCAVSDTGAARCWGWNANGETGDGTTTSRNFARIVPGLETGISSVETSGGWITSYVVTTTGAVKVWGGANPPDRLVHDFAPLPSGVAKLEAGWLHTCALMTSGSVKCWGDNSSGQLGNPAAIETTEPVDVANLSDVANIDLGGSHSCAVTNAGVVKCWGSNWHGRSGNPQPGLLSIPEPYEVTSLGSGVRKISAGGEFTCAVLSNGAIRCFGRNSWGQLGDGTTIDRPNGTQVAGLPQPAVDVFAAVENTCAILADKTVWCWGDNSHGQLGTGTTALSSLVPVKVNGVSDAEALDGENYFICALTEGTVKCWGQLGHMAACLCEGDWPYPKEALEEYKAYGIVQSGGSLYSTKTIGQYSGQSVTTDASGRYLIPALMENTSFFFQPQAECMDFSPSNIGTIVEGEIDQNFDVSLRTYKLTLAASVDYGTSAGISFQSLGVSTDSAGNASFSGNCGSSYSVTPSKTGYTFTPESSRWTANGESSLSFSGTINSYEVGGQITAQGAAVPGVNIAFELDGAPANTAADNNGGYSLGQVRYGTAVRVVPSKDYFVFSPAEYSTAVHGPTTIDFTAKEDRCPADPQKDIPGICGCGVPDDDSDSDGTANCVDDCPTDRDKTAPGICGCGSPEGDTNGDLIADCGSDTVFSTSLQPRFGAVLAGTHRITLVMEKIAGATSYEAEVSKAGRVVKTAKSTSNTLIVSNLKAGAYSVRFRVLRKVGKTTLRSGYSETRTVAVS